MSLINQEFQKHIKKINNNDFIYKHKIAFYLLSEQQYKLYEEGFKKGFELAQQKMSNQISEIKKTTIIPISTERKIVGYQFKKPKKTEIDSVINKVCIMYEVSKKELFTKTRTRDIVRARNIIHNILNEKYKMSLTEIGRIFAQDHTTVLNSIQMKQKREHYWYDNQTIWQEFDELIKS
jgi:chromosomal replication initiation ATPase DnaA